MILNSILPLLAILIPLVVLHELGHFITAKLTGVKVLEFGIGFPPRIWGFKFRDTIYSINWLPLGGFVRLLGEEDPTHQQSLAAKPRPIRLLVLASGSVVNLILPIFLFGLAFMIPRDVPVGLIDIVSVFPDSPAEEAGLQPGDTILGVNGKELRNSSELGREIRLNMGETVLFRVKRPTSEFGATGGGGILEIPVKARFNTDAPTGIQIRMQSVSFTERESFPLWEAIPRGWGSTIDSLRLARNEVYSWVQGGGAPQVAGPVGIAQATGEAVDLAGWRVLLDIAAVLSINLGIINLLPLPMLDGGRIAFVVLEIIRRGKRVAPQKEAIVHFIGLAAIISLAVVITYFDVLRIFHGDSIFR